MSRIDSSMQRIADAQTTIGTILETDGRRDAIHFAVIPAVAAQGLNPGDRIGIVNGEASRDVTKPTGIVDPFLTQRVNPGQRFWMFLLPNTITGLRHVWEHPAFPEAKQSSTLAASPISSDKDASELWLRSFCAGADCPDYDTVMRAIDGGFSDANDDYACGSFDGEYIHFGGMDAHGDIPPEFWVHAEIVLGRPIERQAATRFSCSC